MKENEMRWREKRDWRFGVTEQRLQALLAAAQVKIDKELNEEDMK